MSVVIIFRHLLFVSALVFVLSPACKSDDEEVQVLLKFKSVMQQSVTKNDVFGSWTEGNSMCSNFTGIVCNSRGDVTEINLARKQLVGEVPFEALCGLKSLERISFGYNFLFGRISENLKNCTRLKYLDLAMNSFTGSMPDFSALRELEFLSLNGSRISGDFPWKSLENLTDLSFLSVGDNPLSSSSFPAEVTSLEKLYWLYLSNISLTGQIPPGISNLTLLENLELSDNSLTGGIPEGIGKLTNLWQFEIYKNDLTGKIPVGFGNLSSLKNFDASLNKLEGDLSELKSLENIVSLELFENKFSGEIPQEFGQFKSLVNLSLYTNKLSGPLPQTLGLWSNFIYIDVSENFLTGPIPPDMCKNGRMTHLLMLQNKLTGGIPETYSNCKRLIRFRVNNNSLSGSVPSGIWGLLNVTIIDLSLNQFEGPLTADIANAKKLATLSLYNNKFSGALPSSISNASSLVSIQLSSNQFSGHIPERIGDLKKLNSFYLDHNLFSGQIPESLGSCVSLADIKFADNSISGRIPASLGSLPTLNSLNLSDNKLSGQIPIALSSLRLSLLDLSNNQLVGPIPDSMEIDAFKSGLLGNPGLCSDDLDIFQPCSSISRKSRHLEILLFCFMAGVFVLLISLGIFVKLRKSALERSLKQSSWNLKPYHVLSFNEIDIIDAVRSENLIGKGGSGNVYKVVVSGGKKLAVKHIWRRSSSDSKSFKSSVAMLSKRKIYAPEFDAEVATLSAIRHVNVVKLYCSITSDDCNLLVYEYLPNGSLWDRLHTCQKIEMGWETRYAIALGAARGLEYLHHGCDRPVIHRDVKSSNILLDEEWKPRIADFGLAKILHSGSEADWSHVIAGTHGYIAPEYAYTYRVNEKSDVYSFGVVLMELVTGKRPIEPEFGENKDIVSWISSKLQYKQNLYDVVDSSITEELKRNATKVLKIAILCTAKVPSLRPSMRMVVQMLEELEPCYVHDVIVKIGGETST